jgi:formate dehydrogenase major subunit
MLSINETDLGTPSPIHPIKIARRVTLSIDGREVSVPAGTSVLRAASEAGIADSETVRDRDARRIRFLPPVPRADRRDERLPRLVHDTVAAGMKVTTQNAKLAEIRRGVMELYISDHPLDMLTVRRTWPLRICRTWPALVGLREVRYGYDGANHVQAPASRRESLHAFTTQSNPCSPRTNPIRISRSIRSNASSARAACAPATTCRARSR